MALDFTSNRSDILTNVVLSALSNVILNAEKNAFCHYFLECGKMATQITGLNKQVIKVCDEHFTASEMKSNKTSFDFTDKQFQLNNATENCLKHILEIQIDALKSKTDNEFITCVDSIYHTLGLLETESDPYLASLTPGYDKEFTTSFLTLYIGTNNIEKSFEAFELIKSLTRYIVLLDKAYDTKNMDYKTQADALYKSIMKNTKGHLKDTIKHTMAILWTIADFEIKLKQRMLNQKRIFGKKEICYHMLQKSSDTVVYSTVLDNYIENFSPNLLQLYHYNQALLDIQDDFNDIEEDIKNQDLNIFIMSVMETMQISDIFNGRVHVDDIKDNSSKMVQSIIDYFETCINELSISDDFSFMKKLSQHYIQNLRISIDGI